MNTVISVLLVIAVLYAALCVVVFIYQEKFIFFPEKLPKDFYFRFQGTYEEHSIPVEDTIALNALLFKAENPKGCVLFHHGNARNLSDWGANASDFTSRGYDVLFYDYRGYGKSEGYVFSEQQLIQDAEKVQQWLLGKYPANHIIQMGRSLGSGIAVQLSVKYSPRLLILETPYASVLKIAQSTLPFLPIRLILKYPFLSVKHLSKVESDIVLLHGTNDDVIPFNHSKELLTTTSKSRLIVVPNGEHNNLPSFQIYQQSLDEFLR